MDERNDGAADDAARPRMFRTPTVQEALQYTPFTSIVPFDPEVVPFPSADPPRTPSLFTSPEEQRNARQTLDSYDAEASREGSTGERLQRKLDELRALLASEELTTIEFKNHSIKRRSSSVKKDPDAALKSPQSRSLGLSPFAELVYRTSKQVSKAPTVKSPHENMARSTTTVKSAKKVSQAKSLEAKRASAKHDPEANTSIEMQLVVPIISAPEHQYVAPQDLENRPPATVTPPKSAANGTALEPAPKKSKSPVKGNSEQSTKPPASSSTTVPTTSRADAFETGLVPMVTVPQIPAGVDTKKYKTFEKLDARIQAAEAGFSRKRKFNDVVDDRLDLAIDQREKADAAVTNLQDVMNEIFVAEDNLQPDTSGVVSDDAAKYFITRGNEDREVATLAPAVQSRLESSIQKVVSLSRFNDISVDHLCRIQKLCEGAVHLVDSTSLAVGDCWSDQDIEDWIRQVDIAAIGLQSGKILLRIMTAGREERLLYSEDILQNILNAVRHVFDTILVPAIECRPSGSSQATFKIFSDQKKAVASLLQVAGRVLKLMGDFLLKIDVAEEAITAIEYLCTRLIFVENGHTEKDSTIGIQKFETTRRLAMDVVAKIFSRYQDQRNVIFDEILTSLEKLPVTRQSARQYKLIDGKPIQLVSALLMRLVQTSATHSLKQDKVETAAQNIADGSDFQENPKPSVSRKRTAAISGQEATNLDIDTVALELTTVGKPLQDGAEKNAHYLVKFMVQRAMTATKTGDQPYRNLLDIFTEDFVSVLGQSDWPAAELLLRVLLGNMIGLMESDKSTAPAKSMALDLMGIMGSAISDLQQYVRQASKSLDTSERLSTRITQLADEILDENADDEHLLRFDGPYRIVLEYVEGRDLNDAQLQSARGFHLMQWAKAAYAQYDYTAEDQSAFSKSLGVKIINMIVDPRWLETEYSFEKVTTSQGKLAAAMLALTMPFCKALKRIFSILLSSMTNDQATVKSRSLKSVVQLLEKDPSILDKGNYVLNHILRCCGDTSPLVRDSALSLIGKCLSLRPALETSVLKTIIARASDAAVGVRKRVMKILKEIYLRNQSKDVKSVIADALLQRIKDSDDSVSDLARQTFEEIWMIPFYTATQSSEMSIQSKLALKTQVTLIINTMQKGEPTMNVLTALLRNLLDAKAKLSSANFRISKLMVSLMLDSVIDSDELPEKSSQHILQTLTVFAKAEPRLFTGEQLITLQPYIGNLSTTDDLAIYRSVIIIYRYVLPTLSALQESFLKEVQQALLASVSKIGRAELEEVATCLWTINGVLKNTERLVRLTISVLQGIYSSKDVNFSDEAQKPALNRVKRYIMIAGFFTKSCDLDDFAGTFKEKFKFWKGTSVAGLSVDMMCPFTRPKQHPVLREIALESIGMICQAWPKQFLRADVNSSFDLVFKDREPRLEQIVLDGFRGFFVIEENRSATGAEIAVGDGVTTGSQRLGKSLMANENDGVSTCIAQGFLQDIIRLALGPPSDTALTATRVIASINRQGLMHPKECGPALVALETSPSPLVSNIAFQEHRALHEKHETMFEKEYMKSVYQAFTYQKDIVGDAKGAITQPGSNSSQLVSKLRLPFDVLKLGNSKSRKRFLANLVSRMKFDLSQLGVEGDPPEELQFARFICENLAFFDYARIDEIIHVTACLEKLVSTSGTSVAHAIETDILQVKLDTTETNTGLTNGDPSGSPHTNGAHMERDTILQSDLPSLQPVTNPTVEGPETALPEEPVNDIVLQPADQSRLEILGDMEPSVTAPVAAKIDPARLRRLTIASMILYLAWETRTFLRRLWALQKLRDSANASKAASGNNKTALKDLSKAPLKTPGVTTDKFRDRVIEIMSRLDSIESMHKQCKDFAALLAIDDELKVADEEDDDFAKAAAGYETPSGEEDAPNSAPGSGRGRKRKSSSGPMGANGTPRKKRKSSVKKRRGSGSSESGDFDDGGWD